MDYYYYFLKKQQTKHTKETESTRQIILKKSKQSYDTNAGSTVEKFWGLKKLGERGNRTNERKKGIA